MYEAILGTIDAMASSLGVLRKEQRVRPGDNPWGYTNGARVSSAVEKETKEWEFEKENVRDSKMSFESTAATLVGKSEIRRA